MKNKKYTCYLLIFCFSAFLGHNLVPHHHHAELYQYPITTDCPFEHGDHPSDDHDGGAPPVEHPVHCHAFNEVVFEKYNAPENKPWAGQVLTLPAPGQDQRGQIQDQSAPLFNFNNLRCSTPPDLGSRALRAPPALT